MKYVFSLSILPAFFCLLSCNQADENDKSGYRYSYIFYPALNSTNKGQWEQNELVLKKRFQYFFGKDVKLTVANDSMMIMNNTKIPDAIFDQYLLTNGKLSMRQVVEYKSPEAKGFFASLISYLSHPQKFQYVASNESMRLQTAALSAIFLRPGDNDKQNHTEVPSLGYITEANLYLVQHLLQEEPVKKMLPANTHISIINSTDNDGTYGVWLINDKGDALELSGSGDVDKVDVGKSSTGLDMLQFTMAKKYQQPWAEMTNKYVGHHIAFLLDGKLLNCPLVNERIGNGFTAISMHNAPTTLKAVASVLVGDTLEGEKPRWTYGY